VEFQAIFSNLFNHVYLSDPYLVLGDKGDWGRLAGSAVFSLPGRRRLIHRERWSLVCASASNFFRRDSPFRRKNGEGQTAFPFFSLEYP